MSEPIIAFTGGTVTLRNLPDGLELPGARLDVRSACWRAPARCYADLVLALRSAGVSVDDRARAYTALTDGVVAHRTPRPFQREALDAWRAARGRGVVVLPTGAGKSHVAVMAIDDRRRSTLVIAPTLDLVRQWYDLLRASFGVPVGLIGGGEHDVQSLTVSTYDSAYLHMDHLGARFGLVVFDECHHLPGASYRLAADACLAPFRLGLSATPDRSDGLDLEELVGPTVYRKDIVELAGEYLAEYDTERIQVGLTAREREEYQRCRGVYLDFVRQQGIRMGSPAGWQTFIQRAGRGDAGRRALDAYRRQREIAFSAEAKLGVVEMLLNQHRNERAIVFTEDNATAYRVARRFLVPVITHQTKVRERSEILERFASGVYGAVVTSKVLNEGVDVPDASVAVVLSGSGSVREHVQRLGRILRRKGDKRAVLYEVVSRDTAETSTSERRRDHDAYR